MQPAEPASHTFEPALVATRIDELLRSLPGLPTGLCVAYSGGLDSTVLLHALARLADRASRPRLRAVHVDHGLNPQSPQWSIRCGEVATALGIDCRRLAIDARAPRGASPEAWARAARRAAIAADLGAGEVLLTAHHADDQLETVLLQLLRGGGPAGIAGMPRLAPFGRGWQLRPLLEFSRDSLHRWAVAARLDWVEDPTNLDLAFDRNYLRHSVLPSLRARWPQATRTIGQAAALTAETVELAAVLAESDFASVREGLTLPIAALGALSEPRQRAVLRAWLAGHGLPLPSVRTLAALRRDLWLAAADRVPCARWQEARVYRYRGRLYADRSRPPAVAEANGDDGGGCDARRGRASRAQGYDRPWAEPCSPAGAARAPPAPWWRALPSGAGRASQATAQMAPGTRRPALAARSRAAPVRRRSAGLRRGSRHAPPSMPRARARIRGRSAGATGRC